MTSYIGKTWIRITISSSYKRRCWGGAQEAGSPHGVARATEKRTTRTGLGVIAGVKMASHWVHWISQHGGWFLLGQFRQQAAGEITLLEGIENSCVVVFWGPNRQQHNHATQLDFYCWLRKLTNINSQRLGRMYAVRTPPLYSSQWPRPGRTPGHTEVSWCPMATASMFTMSANDPKWAAEALWEWWRQPRLSTLLPCGKKKIATMGQSNYL